MSKINQIQNKLRELEGGAFQKLADAYLHKKGYERINPLGSVIGANKVRKGTPDTLIALSNGKHVFAEYTTQQESLYSKIEGDLLDCFDEIKTGVLVAKIEEVVFCHTSILSPEHENALAEKCQKQGVNLNLFGIGPISYDLYQKYPGLAREFLGVEVDTGQIVPADEFVIAYNKNKCVTRLDTAFHFRQIEVGRVLQALGQNNLVIVSGRAGVGKSRLAIECCERFKKANPEYEVRCIFNRGVDLFEDLRVYFSEPEKYLILVDDANRVNRFDYIVQLLQDQREDQRIKMVVTVRDYAQEKIREMARPCGGGVEIELKPLEEQQIKQLVENEYEIYHSLYLDRIADIAQGNPRLAVMAAEIAKSENTLQSILNVSMLYDEYFASIRQDLEELGESSLLKVAGILAFFRVVDRSNEEMMGAIQEAFGISPQTFWEAALRLHDLEIVDMYEDEVVRTSDQVLATYLFYLAFFKKRTLDFSILLNHFFPRFRHRLVDAIIPLLNAFDRDAIMEAMRPHVDKVWRSMQETGNEEGLLHLMDVFWFLKQTDILLFIRKSIDEMEPKSVNLSNIDFMANSVVPSPSLLSLLSSFKNTDAKTFKIALELLCNYVVKRPEDAPYVLHLLTDRFGFKLTSYLNGFSTQRAVINVLCERAKNGEEELFSRLFFAVAEQYLQTHFLTTEPKGEYTCTVTEFKLPPEAVLFDLRQQIWKQLFQFYQTSTFREAVLKSLHTYSTSTDLFSEQEVVANDAKSVLPFIDSNLDSARYDHCLLVNGYFDFLDNCEVSFDQCLRNRFTNETYKVSRLFIIDWGERRKLNIPYEKYERLKKEQIDDYFYSFGLAEYKRFFEQCLEIQAGSDRDQKNFQFQSGIVDLLVGLGDRKPELYAEVLEHYLELGDPFGLNSLLLVAKLIKIAGVERAYEIVNQYHYATKNKWLFAFYQSLPAEGVTLERLSQLYTLYESAKRESLPYDFDFLLKYQVLDKDVVVCVTQIVLHKTETEPTYVHNLSRLFFPFSESNKAITELFADQIDLLKRAYLLVLKNDQNADFDGSTYTRILDRDPKFIIEYIDQMYNQNEWVGLFEDIRDYNFLWVRNDYENLMTQLVEHIFKRERKRNRIRGTFLEALFGIRFRENGNADPEVREKQDHFLREIIKHKHSDGDFMEFVFSVIGNFPPERRCPFVSFFLEYNKKFEVFERLSLEPNMLSWSGSAVPILQKRMEYFESLIPLLNTAELLQHKQYMEQIIQRFRQSIEREKKKDFMRD